MLNKIAVPILINNNKHAEVSMYSMYVPVCMYYTLLSTEAPKCITFHDKYPPNGFRDQIQNTTTQLKCCNCQLMRAEEVNYYYTLLLFPTIP